MLPIWNHLTGRPGPTGFGSGTTAEEVTAGLSLASQTVIITGATSGLGRETARVLAKRGAHVVIPARNVKVAEEVRDSIVKELPDATITVGELDLSSLESVRKFVADFKSQNLPLNILINNAGIVSSKFLLSVDGLELDFATNHMGHFLLTRLLLDNMIETADKTGIEGRIVIVSSEGYKLLKEGDIDFEKQQEESFRWDQAYGRSKLANILHTKELAKRLKERGVNVTVNAVHPGAIKTNLARDFSRKSFLAVLLLVGTMVLKTVPQGAATQCYVATHPTLKGITGKYFADCNEYSCSSNGDNMDHASSLWHYSDTFVKND